MYGEFKQHLQKTLHDIESAGLLKKEREISSPQNSYIQVNNKPKVLNLCANNYLGLAQHPDVNQAAQEALTNWGYGMASVRFICGTQGLHKQLEQKLSQFLTMDDTILYSSCFDANGGLFETLLSQDDAIISDELNHASIIDGIRLCKAKRYRYKNNDMEDLEQQLKNADQAGARFKMITTDGVFSMDGYIARLDEICDLADRYHALVHFDDCHATGFIGKTGRGTHELKNCMGRVDLVTGTLGKALGGASGGYTAGRKEIIQLLRQRSRPYLFSNTLAPAIVGASLKVLALLENAQDLREQLFRNTEKFRQGLASLGFDLLPGTHPIVPIMLYDGAVANQFSQALLAEGVYATAFSYPVVPKGKARLHTQMSAALSESDIDFALSAFAKVKNQLSL